MSVNISPAVDELEVSLFGPGYGEAIALHLGRGKWVLVDSCIDPIAKAPATLHYLSHLGVDIAQAVKLIVATHWHDDHVRGISTVFQKCQSAELVISTALSKDKFLELIGLYHSGSVMQSSGIDEFVHIFQQLDKRKKQGVRFNAPKFALADRVLFREEISLGTTTVEANISSLSPSDEAVLQALLAFERLFPHRLESKKRITSPSPNHASVALWCAIGDSRILLGADLECTSNPKTGWSVILDDSSVLDRKASVFKVPHHGSKNAHHDGIWDNVLIRGPFAILTPYNRGSTSLPSSNDIARIVSLTSHAFLTAPTATRSTKWRKKVVRDTVKQATKNIRNVHQGWGHIRLRKRIGYPNKAWRVELFGDARPL
ncbi:MAG: hypothetical protein GXP42_09415 [Chloroflexi bacterium]|nr:hypothetical protein [Chloroflexota bacterium]